MGSSSILGSDMKKFFLFAAMVFLALMALMFANDALNRHLVFSMSNSNPYKMQRLFVVMEEGEIPILGSSRAEAGFAPKEISDNAFNYGLSGSSARETVFHLKAVMSRPGNGLVIVNLDPWGLGNGMFLGDYRFAADNPLVRSEPKIHIPFTDLVPGIRFQGKTRRNIAEFMNNRLAVTKTMERGAILQRLSRSKDEWNYLISRCVSHGYVCDDETKAMLSEILSSNTLHEVVFVVSPIAKPWWDKFTGQEALLSLENWLRLFPHVHVIGFAEASQGYELSEFMDLTHLNESGARHFSQALKDRLKLLGLL